MATLYTDTADNTGTAGTSSTADTSDTSDTTDIADTQLYLLACETKKSAVDSFQMISGTLFYGMSGVCD